MFEAAKPARCPIGTGSEVAAPLCCPRAHGRCPALCEVNACGVIAGGRCSSCNSAFCLSHGSGQLCHSCHLLSQPTCALCDTNVAVSTTCVGCGRSPICPGHVGEVRTWRRMIDAIDYGLLNDVYCVDCHSALAKRAAEAAARQATRRVSHSADLLERLRVCGVQPVEVFEEGWVAAPSKKRLFASKGAAAVGPIASVSGGR